MQRERSGRCGLASRLSLTETAARPNCLGPRVCTFRRAPDAQAVCCRRRRDQPLTPTQFVRHEPTLPVCWPRRSGDLPPPSRQGEKSTASQYQARQSGTEDGPWDGDTEREQLGAELSTRELCGVDVEIRQPVFDSCDQRRFGLLHSALHVDEGRIEERRVLQTKDWREVGPLGRSQREPGKCWHSGGDADV